MEEVETETPAKLTFLVLLLSLSFSLSGGPEGDARAFKAKGKTTSRDVARYTTRPSTIISTPCASRTGFDRGLQ
ncbi:hypothetical protein MRB53_002653 [Persea americana]|uniref:Uncharacterized protein n=1 Tax=Persea americana TaxID=3435 RepID=A0ACC2MV67_PERAE|nr:hypothetical protein MRB53_002653 [Persea americana]